MPRKTTEPPTPPAPDKTRQNATDFDVPPNQRIAIEALLAGKTMTAAAEAAGVTRATLWRWSNKDPEFQAALNSFRREAYDLLRMRTASLASLAIDAVEKALRGDDEKTALAVLRGLGFLNGTRELPPTDDLHALKIQQRQESYARLMSDMNYPELF